GKGYNCTINDRKGDLLGLEAPCPLVQSRRPAAAHHGKIFSVNLSQLPLLERLESRPADLRHNAVGRRKRLNTELAGTARGDLEEMKRLLRLKRHGDNAPLCNGDPGDLILTTRSTIFQPKRGLLAYCDGRPSENEYTEVSVDNG
ncbi:MAG: hypothetical protein ACYTGH_10765, partial [Planctomycetota bacterium]